jgi:dGTPase
LYRNEDYSRVAEVFKGDKSEPFRSPFRRDIARLIHSPSFRRLQGKTQVFPGNDSDFFRNRLTHSLEVAQIAKSLAIRLNATNEHFRKNKIDPDLTEFAALAHDLGHPPFGHNGEEALDELMCDHGGFEGNAQTLHILAKTEKKETLEKIGDEFVPIDAAGRDLRCGLNLSYRSLAAVLKYDHCIPSRNEDRKPEDAIKGYYVDERDLVVAIKKAVIGDESVEVFKTIECSIMDISDDIAYSTYDLEDCFKAKFLTPLDLFTLDDGVVSRAVKKIKQRIEKSYGSTEASSFDKNELIGHLFAVFAAMFDIGEEERKFLRDRRVSWEEKKFHTSAQVKQLSERVAENGFERVRLTSELVQAFMDGVEIDPHEKFPQLHRAKLNIETFKTVEVLKNITYEAIIMSSRVKLVEYRGKDIIKKIFHAIDDTKGHLLLPDDYRELHTLSAGSARKRVICDFIAGMTDRYAWEFYNRLYGASNITIHKPI